MKCSKVLISFALVLVVFLTQFGTVSAAPATDPSVSGMVTALACQTDTVTGGRTFLVTIQPAHGPSHEVRVDQAAAESLGLVELTGDGNPECSLEALARAVGMEVTIDSADILPSEEKAQHPVGAALATFFSEITSYDAIMEAHENGAGFGLIAQALWLTEKLNGDTDTFVAILQAKKTGDYSAFTFEDGTPVPQTQNWGQFRRLILDGDKNNGLGVVMSNKDQDHGNNGSGNGNGQGNGNANGGGNGQDNANDHPDKDKNNDKGNNTNNEDKGNGEHP